MKIEVRQLMDDNEMLSHIFLGCISLEDLKKIKEKHIGEKDWEKESVKIPVEMKIGGVPVKPKAFFDEWKNQMSKIISKKATKLLSEKLGSEKIREFQNSIFELEEVIKHFESSVNWEVENPFK